MNVYFVEGLKMNVKLTAIRTAGFGCVKGEVKNYNAETVIDKGDYYCIVTNSNPLSPSEVRARKENYSIEISQ